MESTFQIHEGVSIIDQKIIEVEFCSYLTKKTLLTFAQRAFLVV